MTNSKSFGVIGLGSVGWAVVHGLSQYYPYFGYDIEGEYSWESILLSDIVFVCVSTPSNDGGRLDCSAVNDVLERLASNHYSGCIVIKSTLAVGFMDQMVMQYPSLRLVYMPEFLREKSSFTWFTDPDRLVLSGTSEDIQEVMSYFSWVDSRIPVLLMSHISAEIGKLAHNAYIATKVSFTNEMELICSEHGADALDVMSTIWADRRVYSQEHLTPYLGPYMGKCVPKDTRELLNSGKNHALLNAVEEVNSQIRDNSSESDQDYIISIVPTCNRPDYLERAINSLSIQKRVPDAVYVVIDDDDPSYYSVKQIVQNYDASLPITLLQNERTNNLSGAVNTGIEVACKNCPLSESVFVALLDDDDWWDRSYLANVSKYAQETKADWIVSGLIRHDDKNPSGSMQSIPSKISQNLFYVSNPNIQGSNIFVRLSNLREICGFDEKLISTTDRDICIRLLDAGTVPAILNNHLVHHDADRARERLSSQGSEKKKAGLQYFYEKYSAKMSSPEKDAFKARSEQFFGIFISEAK